MRNKISGIYKITNNITGDFYIGSSKNIRQRWYVHKCVSTWARQPNFKLYQDMQKYGISSFLFEILEETDNLLNREQYYIDQLNPSYNSNRAKRTKEICLFQMKQSYRLHREERIAHMNKRYKYHREEQQIYYKNYSNRLCLYNGETITFNILRLRFSRQGILHPCLEAKKYLLDK